MKKICTLAFALMAVSSLASAKITVESGSVTTGSRTAVYELSVKATQGNYSLANRAVVFEMLEDKCKKIAQSRHNSTTHEIDLVNASKKDSSLEALCMIY